MIVTSIKQQVKRDGRYSIYVDGTYAFSLSADALIKSGLSNGAELSMDDLAAYKQQSADDKLYNNVLRYIALRPRSKWEIEQYFHRKQASDTATTAILNMLTDKRLIDDNAFAQSYVESRRLLKPTSRRRLRLELLQKHVSEDVINDVLNGDTSDDQHALEQLISKKRRQTRYHDNEKLMQYLARQGFNYSDIKQALQNGY